MSDPVYSGEALLRNWSETANGKRRVVFEIEDNGGAHPFKGYEGERFAVVVMGPLASDEHESLGGAEKGNRKPAGQPVHSKRSDGTEPPPATDSVTPGGGETGGSPSPLSLTPPVPKHKRRWSEMPPSQRAGIRMNERQFQEFAAEQMGMLATATTADSFIKWKCDVESKSDIVPGEAALRFDILDRQYQAWLQAKQHGVI